MGNPPDIDLPLVDDEEFWKRRRQKKPASSAVNNCDYPQLGKSSGVRVTANKLWAQPKAKQNRKQQKEDLQEQYDDSDFQWMTDSRSQGVKESRSQSDSKKSKGTKSKKSSSAVSNNPSPAVSMDEELESSAVRPAAPAKKSPPGSVEELSEIADTLAVTAIEPEGPPAPPAPPSPSAPPAPLPQASDYPPLPTTTTTKAKRTVPEYITPSRAAKDLSSEAEYPSLPRSALTNNRRPAGRGKQKRKSKANPLNTSDGASYPPLGPPSVSGESLVSSSLGWRGELGAPHSAPASRSSSPRFENPPPDISTILAQAVSTNGHVGRGAPRPAPPPGISAPPPGIPGPRPPGTTEPQSAPPGLGPPGLPAGPPGFDTAIPRKPHQATKQVTFTFYFEFVIKTTF